MDRRIVFIRAAHLPPLYIEHQGGYYLIEAYLVPVAEGRRLIEATPECLRVGDWVIIRYWNPSHERSCIERLPIWLETRFTEVTGLRGFVYA